jgi:uncharacterized protein DUF6636
MKARLAVLALALALTACGTETPIQTNAAGGDPDTRPAPTATASPMPTETATPTPVTASSAEAFRTPTGRFVCQVVENGLTCDVRQQDGDTGYPVPDKDISPQCDEIAPKQWGNGVTLPFESEAFALCATDVSVTADRTPVLAYGDRWERDGFTCASASEGLTCERGEHGFFVNKDVIETH